MSPIKVLSVASEIFPLVKTGGLADVVGALPSAVAADGIISTTLVPGYPAVLRALEGAEPAFTFENLFGGPARLLAGSAGPLDLLVIDAPHLYGRTGLPYTGVDGRDWPDNAQRFAALGKVAAMVGSGLVPASSRTSCTCTTGRRALRRPISIMAAAGARRSSAPSTIWRSRACSLATCSKSWGFRPRPSPSMESSTMGRSAI